MRTPAAVLGGAVALVLGCGATAQEDPLRWSYNDYGGIGLLQTRTARMADDGRLAFGYARFPPHQNFHLTFQALPWLEVTFRYDIFERKRKSNDRDLYDRAFDTKIRLLEETRYFPALAVGLQDVLGTGVSSGEYLVASKRYHDFDFSLGLGWGRLGSHGDFGNPLSRLSDRFTTRSAETGEGGRLRLGDFFSGRDTAPFGGVEYITPVDGLRLKLEFTGDAFLKEEVADPGFEQRTRVNFGVGYRPAPWIDLEAGYEQGDLFMLRATFSINAKTPRPLPKRKESPPALPRREAAGRLEKARAAAERRTGRAVGEAAARPAQAALAALLRKDLKAVGLDLRALSLDRRKVVVHFENARYRDAALAIGRGARVIANALPRPVEEITLVLREQGLETARLSLLRKDLENALAAKGSPQEIWRNVRTAPATGRTAGWADVYPIFDWSIDPKFRQGLFDPDAPYLYQVAAEASGSVRPLRGLDLSAVLGLGLFDNFDRSTRRSNSVLPHVRSDVIEYIKRSRNGAITRLQANYMWNAAPDLFARVTGGYLEEMFAGVGGEVLYRPQNARWALGMELHRVRQRAFDQRFDFRDYRVTTGHVNLHYDIPFHGYRAGLSAGRYLARDWGATLELIRRFDSGIEVGGFFTLTDVPFDEFGEGSFDKGLYLSIPLDIFFTRHTRRRGSFVMRPLTRDGGQRLASSPRLLGVTEGGRLEDIARNWPTLMD